VRYALRPLAVQPVSPNSENPLFPTATYSRSDLSDFRALRRRSIRSTSHFVIDSKQDKA
jgi:hypothetical protein